MKPNPTELQQALSAFVVPLGQPLLLHFFQHIGHTCFGTDL